MRDEWIDVKRIDQSFCEMDKARFWSSVSRTEYCWEWKGSATAKGYGTFRMPDASYLAHRVAYTLIYGDPGPELHVLHKCDNPPCVNPSHLFTGTHLDNMADMRRKGRGRLSRSSRYLRGGLAERFRAVESHDPNQRQG